MLWGYSKYFILAALLLGPAGIGMSVLEGAPLEQWHWRNPLPQGNRLENIFFINGNWLAVGDLGTVLASDDGTNWLRQDTGVLDNLHDCAYGMGTYVVVGDWGTVLTSTNGVVWHPQYAGTFYSLNGITYANGEFVAVGENTTILTSPDGINWTQRSSGDWNLFEVIHSEGMFVAVGGIQATGNTVGEAVILVSPDARVWTRQLQVLGDPIATVAYGNGRFAVAIAGGSASSGAIWTSEDGVTWQLANLPIAAFGDAKLFFKDGAWLLAEVYRYYNFYTYPELGTLRISTNLLDWIEVMTNRPLVTGVAFADGQFVASHADGTLSTSANVRSWPEVPHGARLDNLRDLEFINGAFCAIGPFQAENPGLPISIDSDAGECQLAFSTDGAVWTNRITLTNMGNLHSITYGKGRYVAGGEYRTIWTSTNGLDWTNPAPDLSIKPYVSDVAVAYGNGVFVGAAGYNGDILTSPDGLNWMAQQLNTNFNRTLYFADVKFGNGRFVAVGNNAIATSIDGTNWNLTASDQTLNSVACGKGIFVVSGDRAMLTSSDGTNWTARVADLFQGAARVVYGEGYFVAIDAQPYYETFPAIPLERLIWVSTDGVHWFRRHSYTSRMLDKAAFGNGTFVLAGVSGAVLSSDPLVSLALIMQPSPQLLLSGPVNCSYRIEYLTDLANGQWNELGTFSASNMPASFVDTTWTNCATRLYRAMLMP